MVKQRIIKLPIAKTLPIFIPGVYASFFFVQLQIGTHGGYHLGYVYQILNNLIPPENVALPGYPANIYWLYHALIAAILNLSNIPAPKISSTIINMFALVGSFYWTNKTLMAIDLKNKSPFRVSCYAIFIVFGLNLFFSVHILINYFIEVNTLPNNLLEFFKNSNPRIMGSDIRLSNLYMKYLNFNSAPLGIMYFLAALYYVLVILRDKLTLHSILFLMLSVVGALVFHATNGIFILITFPIALIITFLYFNKNNLKNVYNSIKTLDWILLSIVASILFIPILHHIYLAAMAMPPDPHQINHRLHSLKTLLLSTYPLFLLSAIAIYCEIKKLNKLTLFLILLNLLGFVLAILVYLPGNNQYKFIFLSSIPICILIIISLENIYYTSGKRVQLTLKFAFSIVLICLLLNILFVGIYRFESPRLGDEIYYYEGKQVHLKSGVQNKDVYEWLRKNTPKDTIIILPLEAKDQSKIYIIAERLPYVVCGHLFVEGFEEYSNRIENIMTFFDDKKPPPGFSCRNIPGTQTNKPSSAKQSEILNEFKKYNSERPSVLMIPKKKLDNIVVDDEILELLYRGKHSNVYGFKK